MKIITIIAMIGLTCLSYGDVIDSQAVEESGAVNASSMAGASEDLSSALQAPVKAQAKKSFGPGAKPGKTTSKAGDSPTPRPQESSSGMRLVLGMALLIGVMAVTFYILKKFSRRMSGDVSGSAMRILQRVQVDSKNSIVMLRVREEEILVSVGPGGSSLLARFEAIDDEFDSLSEKTPADSSDALPVSQLGLAAFLKKNIQGGVS